MRRIFLAFLTLFLCSSVTWAELATQPLPGQLVIKGSDEGTFTMYTPDGKTAALSEGNSDVWVGPDIKAKITYDPVMGFITVKNECDSKGQLKISILHTELTAEPCEEKTLFLSTAEENMQIPEIPNTENTENPEEGREPISPTVA